jgi:poly(A) polymerase Pap1
MKPLIDLFGQQGNDFCYYFIFRLRCQNNLDQVIEIHEKFFSRRTFSGTALFALDLVVARLCFPELGEDFRVSTCSSLTSVSFAFASSAAT